MLSPDDIKALGLRKYPAVLRAIAAGENPFPMPIRFGQPSPGADWSVLQREITALAAAEAATGYVIAWEEKNTRRWGRQRLPTEVSFAAEADYLRMLGKTAEVQRFRTNLALTRHHCPELESWLASHASRVVDNASDWPDVLQVCRYFIGNPRPDRYARELPIPVGTKFIENRRALFRSLLDFLLPAETVRQDAEHFETRFGLRYDEALIRWRVLDPALLQSLRLPASDLSAPFSQFQALPWRDLRVVIVENKMTFLTLPALNGVIAVWGGGNAATLLPDALWLNECSLYYWGDLDAHGLNILARLRRAWPGVAAVMMDEETLDRFEAYHVAAAPAPADPAGPLGEHELRLYRRLQTNNVLLEQEKISHAYALQKLRHALP